MGGGTIMKVCVHWNHICGPNDFCFIRELYPLQQDLQAGVSPTELPMLLHKKGP